MDSLDTVNLIGALMLLTPFAMTIVWCLRTAPIETLIYLGFIAWLLVGSYLLYFA